MRLLGLGGILACTFALGAVTALAAPAHATIVGKAQDLTFGPPTAACSGQDAIFEVHFAIVSPQRDPLGAGVSCVRGWDGAPCPDILPQGCNQTTLTTFVLTFSGGSITAPMILDETFVGGGVLVQHGSGQIASGTGSYAGATGTIQTNGNARLPDGIHLTLVIRLN